MTPQMSYRFRVAAIDVNGLGAYSDEISFKACTPPSNIANPVITEIKRTKFTVNWAAPSFIGGCPITSYELLRDDGNGSNVDTPVDPTTFDSRQHLYQYEVAMDSTYTGKKINVKVVARNSMGFVNSKSTLLVLADVPSKPFPAPAVE